MRELGNEREREREACSREDRYTCVCVYNAHRIIRSLCLFLGTLRADKGFTATILPSCPTRNTLSLSRDTSLLNRLHRNRDLCTRRVTKCAIASSSLGLSLHLRWLSTSCSSKDAPTEADMRRRVRLKRGRQRRFPVRYRKLDRNFFTLHRIFSSLFF